MKNENLTITTLMLLLMTLPSQAEELVLYGDKHVVRIHSKTVQLSKKAFKGEKFRAKSYYGAFAYGGPDAWWWANGHGNLETAYSYALNGCNAHVRPNEPKCKIYGSIVPKGYKETDGLTLSHSGTKGYKEYLTKTGYKAFAMNVSGTWRWRAHGDGVLEIL